MKSNNWNKTVDIKPDNDRIVETMDCGGHVQNLRFYKNLWFFPDRSMYVYYVPGFWRDI